MHGPSRRDEAMQGLDTYEHMVDTFRTSEGLLEVMGSTGRTDGQRHRCMGGYAASIPSVAARSIWERWAKLAVRSK
jgi:hypothetical protein